MDLLRSTIWKEEYQGCRFRFRPEFLKPLHRLANQVRRRGRRHLSVMRWETLLTKYWGIQAQDLGQQSILILQLLGSNQGSLS